MSKDYVYDRKWIEQHIPHAGTMCLLDGVQQYDDNGIRTIANNHLALSNPLRNTNRLGIAIGIEYAAQSVAVHGALLQPCDSKPRVGYLVSARDVQLYDDRLDKVEGVLLVKAQRISNNDTTVLYQFEISSGDRILPQRTGNSGYPTSGYYATRTGMIRRALVTGGSGSIGAAICRRLAADGFSVVIHANRNVDIAERLADEIQADGNHAEAVAFDVSDNAATAFAIENLLMGGPIQVLVNNAGVHDDAAFPGMQTEQWHRVMNVNLNGFLQCHVPFEFADGFDPGGDASSTSPRWPQSLAIAAKQTMRRPKGRCTPQPSRCRSNWRVAESQ